ncbi:hypothetical protein LAZ67_3003152 [Cordylochernes scorpioides]|uniref:Uncharacterized protein n=1 Tax=Cordylochernes scorpioides TaxID=51811 RepID=A0ABY6K8F0_9ARAC|nr:hypothetical protein LAZ67_3003152 [Cordylochernes scorpioides]
MDYQPPAGPTNIIQSTAGAIPVVNEKACLGQFYPVRPFEFSSLGNFYPVRPFNAFGFGLRN